uniref:Uncharacterized protein n=1 Tax=viral metagenome TaxID=1070528 RepID=A0A6C0H2B6_9ZZZZ
MCSLKKIIYRFHEYPDILINKYNSPYDYMRYCNFIRMLNHYCKCNSNDKINFY